MFLYGYIWIQRIQQVCASAFCASDDFTGRRRSYIILCGQCQEPISKKSYPALDSAIRLLIQPGDISLRWRSKRSSSFSDYWEGAWTQSASESESDSQSKPEAARAFQNPRMLAARILKQERRDSRRQPSGHKVRYNRHGPIPAGRPAPCIPKFLFVNRFMIQGYTGDG